MDAEAQILLGTHLIAIIAGATLAWHLNQSKLVSYVIIYSILNMEALSQRRFASVFEMLEQPYIFKLYRQVLDIKLSHRQFLEVHKKNQAEVKARILKQAGWFILGATYNTAVWLIPMLIIFSSSKIWLLMSFLTALIYLTATDFYIEHRTTWRLTLPITIIRDLDTNAK